MPLNQPFDYQQALQKIASKELKPISKHLINENEWVWVRKINSGKSNPVWRYQLLKMIAKLARNPLLTPIINYGDDRSIKAESNRMHALEKAGILVPKVLAQLPNALMMSNIGDKNLLKEWKTKINQPEILLKQWILGLESIAKVHQKKQYLSQCFARNMMYIDDDNIAFIDFEDDPGEFLSLDYCQTRDWLCYLHSGAKIMQQGGVLIEAKKNWNSMIQKESCFIQKQIHKTLNSIHWMRYLKANFWGNDTVRLATMALFL